MSLWAVISGACAALAAAFGKGAFDLDVGTSMPFRVVFGCLMVGCNVLMFTCFAKALATSPSSLQASAINYVVNFIVTALLGFLVLSEPLTWSFVAGSSLMLLGVALVLSDPAAIVQQASSDSCNTTTKPKAT
eukprot:m.185521 g.185521  ORF g.185521 m.185521 type:complete len:133 (-) comp14732_c0_seq4:1039-1437(-)